MMTIEQMRHNIEILSAVTKKTINTLWADENNNIYEMSLCDKVTFGLYDCASLSSEKARQSQLDQAVHTTMVTLILNPIALATMNSTELSTTASIQVETTISISLFGGVENEFKRRYVKFKENANKLDQKLQDGLKKFDTKITDLASKIKSLFQKKKQ